MVWLVSEEPSQEASILMSRGLRHVLVGHRIRTWNRSRQTTVNQSLQRAHGLPLQDGRDSSSSGTSVTQQKAPTLMRRGLRHVLVGHIVYELGTRGH